MDHVLVAVVALFAAALTLFSGFGLGTLLLPAFAVFFPAPVAIGATAVVHLANNAFKLGFVGRLADRATVLRFGVPAVLAAAAGAGVLTVVAVGGALFEYSVWRVRGRVTPVGLTIGTLVAVFALVEFSPRFRRLGFDRRWMPLGGALSGFFGGLSGHQGALRSSFLIRAGLDAKQYIGTTAVCSALVDVARLLVYALGAGLGVEAFSEVVRSGAGGLVLTAIVAAFVGTFIGARAVKKVTLAWVRAFVAVALLLFGAAMAAGVL